MWITKNRLSEQPTITVGECEQEALYFPTTNSIRLSGYYDSRLCELWVEPYLNHEYLHWVLLKLEGLRISTMYDNVSHEAEVSWNMAAIALF